MQYGTNSSRYTESRHPLAAEGVCRRQPGARLARRLMMVRNLRRKCTLSGGCSPASAGPCRQRLYFAYLRARVKGRALLITLSLP